MTTQTELRVRELIQTLTRAAEQASVLRQAVSDSDPELAGTLVDVQLSCQSARGWLDPSSSFDEWAESYDRSREAVVS